MCGLLLSSSRNLSNDQRLLAGFVAIVYGGEVIVDMVSRTHVQYMEMVRSAFASYLLSIILIHNNSVMDLAL